MASNNGINNQALNGFTASGGTINISNDASAATVNLGTGAAVKTVTLGSTNTTSSTQITCGATGSVSINTHGGPLNVDSDGGQISIDSSSAATIDIGGIIPSVKTCSFGSSSSSSSTTLKSGSGALNITSVTGALTINSNTGTISISNDSVNTTINIATGAAVKTVTLGSTNSTSATTIQSGSGNIKLSGGVVYNLVSTSTTPYVVDPSDYAVLIDCSAAIKTVQLPNAPASGKVFVIKDYTGSAASFNITMTTVGGAVNIDGSTSYTINAAYQAVMVIFNGTSYSII